MSNALNVRQNRWIIQSDFARPISGREDPDDLIEECWHHLEVSAEQPHVVGRGRFVTSSELIAARIHAAAGGGTPVDELRELVVRQQATIDRLLAFVPTRARPLSSARLEWLIELLNELCTRLFDNHRINVTEEDDPESDACHRITIDVAPASEIDPEAFVAATIRLLAEVAGSVSEQEFEAIRILVEMNEENRDESCGQS